MWSEGVSGCVDVHKHQGRSISLFMHHFEIRIYVKLVSVWTSQVALVVKNPPTNAGDVRDSGSIPGWGRSPGGGHGNPCSTLAWRIPWTEEPGGLQSMGSQRVGQDWSDLARTYSVSLAWEILPWGTLLSPVTSPGKWRYPRFHAPVSLPPRAECLLTQLFLVAPVWAPSVSISSVDLPVWLASLGEVLFAVSLFSSDGLKGRTNRFKRSSVFCFLGFK